MFSGSSMNVIMTYSADGNEILLGVCPASSVMFTVMQLQVARVGGVPSAMTPSAFPTGVSVADKYGPTHGVGNAPVMRWALPVLLQHINTDHQIGPARVSRGYWPPLFGSQLAHPARPLRPVVRYVSKLLTGYRMADIRTQEFQNLVPNAGLRLSNVIGNPPTKRRFAVLLGMQQDVFLRLEGLQSQTIQLHLSFIRCFPDDATRKALEAQVAIHHLKRN